MAISKLTTMSLVRARGKCKTSKANFQGAVMSYQRTPEHRRLRAELIRKWRPWEQSTGPKTATGKARVSGNANKGRIRQVLRDLRRALRRQDKARRNSG